MTCALFYYAGKPRLKDFLPKKGKLQKVCFPLKEGEVFAHIFPLRLPDKPFAAAKKLNAALSQGGNLGCSFFALSPSLHPLIGGRQPYFVNGSLFALAFLPQLLDKINPNWRYMPIIVPITGGFMAAAARVLGSQARFLHLYAPAGKKRAALARLIYEESGLICTLGKKCPPEGLFILPPGLPKHKTSSFTWQGWPARASLPHGGAIPLYWGEALLWDSLDNRIPPYTQMGFFDSISYLRRLGLRQGIIPEEIKKTPT